jgi:2-polyprenyl-6-hydroxyphenyl methylase/3-demethylubiquinone-9 3-methyltransferase
VAFHPKDPAVADVIKPGVPSGALRFEFGRNWAAYLSKAFGPARLDAATKSLVALTGESDLQGKTFLDIGSGSGIVSLAAVQLGATVTSVDYDPESVACAERLRASVSSPIRWTVLAGSILDPALVDRLPMADIVYSWGVLHHTGAMWNAIRLAASRVPPGGLFCIAIYNTVERRVGGSRFWAVIKRTYVRVPGLLKKVMEVGYGAAKGAMLVLTLRNPVTVARDYQRVRGMSLWHDWVDWLGGYPYEYASAGEIFAFGRDELGFELIRMNTTSSLGCNEFVFRRPVSAPAP